MLREYFFFTLAAVLSGITASLTIYNIQEKLSEKVKPGSAKSWLMILGMFTLAIVGLYFSEIHEWDSQSTINKIMQIRIPSITDAGLTASLYPLPVISSLLLSILVFLLIAGAKIITVRKKINSAQTDKRMQDYFHFKEILFVAIGMFLFKIISYYGTSDLRQNALIACLGLLLSLAALVYEILRWAEYPGYIDQIKRELHSCHVTGIVILCFSFSV